MAQSTPSAAIDPALVAVLGASAAALTTRAESLAETVYWKRRKIKESLYINAYKAKQGTSLMNLE